MDKKPARRVHKKNGMKLFAVIVLLLLAAAAAVIVFMQTHKTSTISDNIYVNSMSVGGMTVKEASDALEKKFSPDYFSKTVLISYNDADFEAELLGTVKLNSEETAKEALDKSNNMWERLFDSKKLVIPFELEIDGEELHSELMDFARKAESKTGVFTFNDDYTSVSVDASKINEIMNTDETLKLIYKNAENDIFTDVDAVMADKDDDCFIDELYSRLNRPASNATVGINDDESTYIIPEEYGVIADKDKFVQMYKENNGIFNMNIQPIEPEVKTEDLDIEFYQDVLGSYTSAYNTGLVNRSKNLSLAARLVNGTIIMPGKRFSYNSVVGPRTYERGFVDATVYTGEGTEEGIGGGICQVSSTIYCAQLRADLKTVSRTNHSYTIVYVPLGQDATVVYGSLDYVFENNTNYPIKIVASAGGGYLTVKIMGTKIDKSSTVDVVSVTESTVSKGETRKETADLPVGQTEVKQNGQNGAIVSTYKIYYKNGIEQRREFIGKSNYRPMNKIILVGTGTVDSPDVPAGNEVPPVPEVTEPDTVTENPPSENEDNPDSADSSDTDINDENNADDTDLPTSDTGI